MNCDVSSISKFDSKVRFFHQQARALRRNELDEDFLFYLGLGLWVTAQFLLGSVLWMDTANLFIYATEILSFGLIGLYELRSRRRYSRYDVIFLCVLACLMISAVTGGSTLLAQGSLFLYCGRYLDFDRLMRFFLILLAALTSLIVFLSLLGVLPDLVFERMSNGEMRHSFGFSYPSRLPNLLLTIFILTLLTCRNKKMTTPLTLVVGLSVLAYVYCGSRGPFYITVLGLALFLLIRASKPTKCSPLIAALISSVFIVGFVAMCYVAATYDQSTPWMKFLNDISSNRLRYSHAAFVNATPSLFGTDAFSGTVDLNQGYLDSSYLQLLFIYGIVPSIILLLFLTYSLYAALRACDWMLALGLFLVGIRAILEWQLTSLMYTPFLFAIAASFGIFRRHSSSRDLGGSCR